MGCSVVSAAKPASDRGSASEQATLRVLDVTPTPSYSPNWAEALVAKLPEEVIASIVDDLAEAVVATLLAESHLPHPAAEDQQAV